MNPSGAELESRRVCNLIIYLFTALGKPIAPWIVKAADNYYGNTNRLDEATKILCEACRSLTKKEEDRLIYDGRDPNARKLADWFDRHQEWDARRVAEEEESRRKIMLKDRALKKLTVEERKALGL
jgi:hypothetical protein